MNWAHCEFAVVMSAQLISEHTAVTESVVAMEYSHSPVGAVADYVSTSLQYLSTHPFVKLTC